VTSRIHLLRDVLRGLPAVSPLSLALALKKPRSLPVFHADVLRAFATGAGARLPHAMAPDLLGVSEPASIRVGEHGIYPYKEADYPLLELCALLKPQRVFEIGTSTGRRTALLAMNVPEGAKIFTLDLPPGAAAPEHASDLHLIEASATELGLHFRDTAWNEHTIFQLHGDSATFDYSLHEDGIDLAIIDGSHTYEYVCSDSFHAFKMIRAGGVLLWHDYESARTEYGVSRFVHELGEKHGLPVRRLGSRAGDNRYAALRVDPASLETLRSLARSRSV
jgi:predicted O-methyltransferase YrrM